MSDYVTINEQLKIGPATPVMPKSLKVVDDLLALTVKTCRSESTQEIMSPKADPNITSMQEFSKFRERLVAR